MNALGFFGLAQLCRLAPAFGNFAHTGEFKPQWRSSFRKSVEIALDQFRSGPAFIRPTAKNTHTHDALNSSN